MMMGRWWLALGSHPHRHEYLVMELSGPWASLDEVNVDASFLPNSGTAALAMVGRNSNAEICLGSVWHCMALSPLMAEALALLKATQYVINMGLHQVIFETDNQSLISRIQQPATPITWDAKSFLMDIRQVSKHHLGFAFNYVPRENNRVADWVARTSLKGQCPSYWAHRPPNLLLSLLTQDGLYT
ncbi:hypothetical protein SLE2022_284380 [Rubroshorea leprosula]